MISSCNWTTNDPHEALYFAIMKTAASDYDKAFKKGNTKEMAEIARDMENWAEPEIVETICRMIESGISPVNNYDFLEAEDEPDGL